VVGTGFRPPLQGLAAALRELAAKSDAPVVAVDLPSGWDADSTAQTAPDAFRADAVVTFTCPKMAHVFGHPAGSRRRVGDWPGRGCGDWIARRGNRFGQRIELGRRSEGNRRAAARGECQQREVRPCADRRRKAMGQPARLRWLHWRRCARGAGLVTAGVPKSILELVAGVAPELMLAPLREGPEGAVSLENLATERNADGLKSLLKAKKISVVALGPGLSTKGEAPSLFAALLQIAACRW